MPRMLGQRLAQKLGQPVVIENRSGAAQNLGAEYAHVLHVRPRSGEIRGNAC